jgi:FKBP-type peptidyl-prolyl cis-trans isomerase (trigger factor)
VEVSEVEWETGQSLRFTARFLPIPEFELPDYRSLRPAEAGIEDPQGALSLRLLELILSCSQRTINKPIETSDGGDQILITFQSY